MNIKKKIALFGILGALVVVLVFQVVNLNETLYFLGQLNLSETGVKMFTAGDVKKTPPVFSACQANDKTCTNEIKVRFQLENGDFISQLSLENGVVQDTDGKKVSLKLATDESKTVKLAKAGEPVEKGLSSADFPISQKDAIYVKGAAGITFKVPESSKGYDFFGLGYWIKQSADIKVVSYEKKTKDGTGTVFVAVPDFLVDRIGGSEIADYLINLSDDVNNKISKALGEDKISYYLVLTPAALAPDFFRSTYYTASGMAYIKIFDAKTNRELVPKYGINFEKAFPNCTKAGDYSKVRCFDSPESKSKLEHLLAHELSHIYQYSRGTLSDKTSGLRDAFWEAGAELNALSITSGAAFKAQVKLRSPDTSKCNSLLDPHKIGLCIVTNYLDDLNASMIKNFFFVAKSYDFSKDTSSTQYCSTWFDLMQEILGKDLKSQKTAFDSKICIPTKKAR